MVEVDEDHHSPYDCSCDNKRTMLLSKVLSGERGDFLFEHGGELFGELHFQRGELGRSRRSSTTSGVSLYSLSSPRSMLEGTSFEHQSKTHSPSV